MAFKRDLDIGKMGENFVKKKMDTFGIETKDGDGKDVDFYIVINGVEYSCECKYDVYANKSGNLAFETFNTKKCIPSGVDATKCQIWFHVLSEYEIYVNTVEELKNYINLNKPFREVSNAGDNNAFLKLYKMDSVIELSGLFFASKEVMLNLCK